MANKVLLIGVDAATFDLIDPWVKQGHLPNLEKIMQQGVRGALKDPWLAITAPRWTTMLTGKNPGKHGVFDFGNMTADYQPTPVSANTVDAAPIQDLLTKAKKTTILLNVPNTYPVHACQGCVIAGMPAASVNEKTVHPPGLIPALKKKGYVILPEEVYERNNEAHLIREMHAMIDVQCQTALELVENEWDFFFFVYFATDMAGHWFWKHMDENHPLRQKRDAAFADTILDVYKKMDDAVGKLVQKAGSQATVLLVSDHGMGPLHKDVFINNWLMREGFMHLKPRALTRLKKALHDAGFTLENAYGVAQRLGVAKATAKSGESAEKARRFLLDHFFISFNDVDWSKTVAFSATNYGPIFINLAGRQREGIVLKEEYDAVRNRIIEKMRDFTDPDGKAVFEKIWKKEELVHGPHAKNAPDIVFQITDMKYTSNRYFEFASNQLFGNPHRGMSGDHRNDGIIIAAGKHIKAGSGPVTANMVDLVPTVLHLLDVPAPDDLDGQPLLDLFDENSEPRLRSYRTVAADPHAAARRRIREAAAGVFRKIRKP